MPALEDLRHLFAHMGCLLNVRLATSFTSGVFSMYRIITSSVFIAVILATAGCSRMPSNLDVSLTHATDENKFFIVMQPPSHLPAINQMHSWQIKVTSPTGTPVTHAQFTVDGGMPQHGHGLPTQPRVTRELTEGTYLLEGMKFSMNGWWEIKLAIRSPEGNDRVTFNIVVAPDSIAR
jgi:hypothetical protein